MIADQRQYLSKVYDDYADSIYRFLLLRTSSVEIAQDLTSETFLRFCEYLGRSGHDGEASGTRTFTPLIQNPRAFLYKTARNLLIDYYRKKDRIIFSDNFNDRLPPDNSMAEKIIKKFDLEKEAASIANHLTKIPEEYAEVIILRHIEEMEFSDIAEIVEKSEGTVRVMLHRGIKELRELILG